MFLKIVFISVDSTKAFPTMNIDYYRKQGGAKLNPQQ